MVESIRTRRSVGWSIYTADEMGETPYANAHASVAAYSRPTQRTRAVNTFVRFRSARRVVYPKYTCARLELLACGAGDIYSVHGFAYSRVCEYTDTHTHTLGVEPQHTQ